MQTSGVAPMFGVISPRYFASLLGSSFLALFCLGVLILAFDMEARDENSRIQEVIASKPVDSFDFFFGRLFGIFTLMGIPMVSIVFLSVVWGGISEIFSIPFGEPVEIWSVVSFLVLDILPNFIFYGFLVLFLASFVRPRFLALFLVVFCVYGMQWVNSRLPIAISAPLNSTTGSVVFPSDLIPTFMTAEIICNRIALVLLGLGFLCYLSVIHSRNIQSGIVQRTRGMYVVTIGMFLVVGMYGAQFLENWQISNWRQVHDAHFDPLSFPDVHRIEGVIDVYPGRSVVLDIDISFSLSEHSSGEEVLFSFNPGYRINQLSIAGEDINDYQFRSGLLKIPRRHIVGDITKMELRASGRPRSQFAYLDSVERVSQVLGPEVRQLRYLGTENYIFRPRFFVLMPGIKWYPVSGSATNEDDWERRPKDYFTVDLTVTTPQNWIVAGPSRRELIHDQKRTTYRFQTENPISQLAFVGSRFKHASYDIGGIEFEILYSSVHQRTFQTLSEAGDTLRSMLGTTMETVEAAGFEYPHSVFSLVEIPASLRVYGGGKKMDTVLSMPGILMMPETTLPTMHLDSLHSSDDFRRRKELNWTDFEWLTDKIWLLWQYFGIELYAGNHERHFYRSIVSDQTSATGSRAELLNLILEQVAQLIFTENEISFDFDLALDPDVLDLSYIEPIQIVNIARQASDLDRMNRLHDLRGARSYKLSTDEVLDAAESLPLVEYASAGVFNMVESRAHRIRALAASRVLIDVLGTDRLSSLIAKLVREHRGQNFSYQDFREMAVAQGINIDQQVHDLLHSSQLPGFVVSNLSKRRTKAEDEEISRYYASFILKNGEAVSGFCRLTPINNYGHQYDTRSANSQVLFVEKIRVSRLRLKVKRRSSTLL